MFQSRHYRIIALILASIRADHTHICPTVWRDIVTRFSSAFARDNARFDAERFADACEPAITTEPTT